MSVRFDRRPTKLITKTLFLNLFIAEDFWLILRSSWENSYF